MSVKIETEEMEDDLFTPSSSTALADIFQNRPELADENASLKYVAPKPNTNNKDSHVDKTTECLFSCALHCYEWFNRKFDYKGRIGFAVMKYIKTNVICILLYDEKKFTLSKTTIQESLKFKLKQNTYLSFYDDNCKYWSVYGSQNEINKVVKELEKYNISVISSTDSDKPTEQVSTTPKLKTSDEINIESDTDSSVHRKTKAAILNRMAIMGQSILPPLPKAAESMSDSSENEYDSDTKANQKLSKTKLKRLHEKQIAPKKYTLSDTDDVVIVNTDPKEADTSNRALVTSSSKPSDVNLLFSEQRIHNCELRMNVGKINDKIDLILHKISHLEQSDDTVNSNRLQNEITFKLLKEYEHKILAYEEILQVNAISLKNTPIESSPSNWCNDKNIDVKEIDALKQKINKLENINLGKDMEISLLKNEIKMKPANLEINDEKSSQVETLKNDLEKKTEELKNSQAACEILKEHLSENNFVVEFDNKLKSIMNETFQSIVANFNVNDNYSGRTITNIVGAVIKTVTLKALEKNN